MCLSGALWWLWWRWPLLTSAVLTPPTFLSRSPCFPSCRMTYWWDLAYKICVCGLFYFGTWLAWQLANGRGRGRGKLKTTNSLPTYRRRIFVMSPCGRSTVQRGSFADSPNQAYTQYFSKITNYNFLLRMFAIAWAEAACLRINLQLWQFAAH